MRRPGPTVVLSPKEQALLKALSETASDFECRATLRGILKRAALADGLNDLGDPALPNVGRIGDIAALIMPTPPIGTRQRAPR